MKTLMAAVLVALCSLPYIGEASAQTAVGTGIANSRSSSIGVGNNFGNQSLRNNNSNTVNVAPQNPNNTGTNAGASNSGNRTSNRSSTTSVLTSNSGNFTEPHQAPSVFAPSVGSSSPCDSYLSLGASGPGAGASFAFPWQNHNCDMRANTLVLQQLGMKVAARQRMCYDNDTAEAMAAAGFQCTVGPRAPKVEAYTPTAVVTPAAALSAPSSDDFYYARGVRYVPVPCSQKHVTHSPDGVCLNRG